MSEHDWIVKESHTNTQGEFHGGSPGYIVSNDPLAIEFDMSEKHKAEFVCRLLNAATDQTAKIAELNKLVEEAQTARAQDQQRLFHYEGLLLDKGLDPLKISLDNSVGLPEPAEVFKVGDRCIYDLGAGRSIPVKVIGMTSKRVKIKDIGGYGRIRYVSMRGLVLDLNPSPE
jgi:hypothetical protein